MNRSGGHQRFDLIYFNIQTAWKDCNCMQHCVQPCNTFSVAHSTLACFSCSQQLLDVTVFVCPNIFCKGWIQWYDTIELVEQQTWVLTDQEMQVMQWVFTNAHCCGYLPRVKGQLGKIKLCVRHLHYAQVQTEIIRCSWCSIKTHILILILYLILIKFLHWYQVK